MARRASARPAQRRHKERMKLALVRMHFALPSPLLPLLRSAIDTTNKPPPPSTRLCAPTARARPMHCSKLGDGRAMLARPTGELPSRAAIWRNSTKYRTIWAKNTFKAPTNTTITGQRAHRFTCRDSASNIGLCEQLGIKFGAAIVPRADLFGSFRAIKRESHKDARGKGPQGIESESD